MRFVVYSFLLVLSVQAEDRLALVRSGLDHLALDPTATFRVRELELSEGGAKFYLSEGVLAFATPVAGKRIAAIFTTSPVEAGDAEVIALPPLSAERASLARFTTSPNLDEHFGSALLFFANDTAEILLQQIHNHPLHPAPELAESLKKDFDEVLRSSALEIEVRITQAILDRHSPANSFFYALVQGRTLGPVDFVFQPDQPDPLVFGRVATRSATPGANAASTYFQIWTAFRPQNLAASATVYHITDYHIDATIHPDLSMSATADFDYQADADDGSVITLFLTPRLRVTQASIDDHPAAILMHDSPLSADVRGATGFLIVSPTELPPGSHHHVRLQYDGTVIRRTADGSYFVDDRNAWYPFITPMLTTFDLTFHIPENLRLVATGDPISEEVSNNQRTIHRRTAKGQAFAGFNIGEFNVALSDHPPYKIEICSNSQQSTVPDLDQQTAKILSYYTDRWMPLTLHTLSVAPIEGYFGQGFPGLIYLSNISYLREKDRPADLRNASLDSFFSRLLLPHELAHQWWGNIVTPLDYHSNWIVEAMSNYAALQYLEQTQGRRAMDSILAEYRADLLRPRQGSELVDSFGPVTFDERLATNFGIEIWHDVLYEKGTWIFHMLRERMGIDRFHEFQLSVLKDFATRPITNEDLRIEASRFLPPNQPDRQLNSFFDTWVYDTGIPTMTIKSGNLQLSQVPDAFTLDVPLNCASTTAWVRVNSGEFPLPSHNCNLPDTGKFLYRQ